MGWYICPSLDIQGKGWGGTYVHPWTSKVRGGVVHMSIPGHPGKGWGGTYVHPWTSEVSDGVVHMSIPGHPR